VYRFLAFFWLLMGMGLLVVPKVYPDLAEDGIFANHVPMAGFCFALSIYNMIRWRLIRAREIAHERDLADAQRRRERNRSIDPAFDFSDAKPSDKDKPAP
jgi:hypothetical protein